MLISQPKFVPILIGIALPLLILAFVITPFSSHGDSATDFWWSRIAPLSYSVAAVKNAEYFYTRYGRACAESEDLAQSWGRILRHTAADSLLKSMIPGATAAGRLYIAAGLAKIRSSVLEELSLVIERDTTRVMVLNPDSMNVLQVAASELLMEGSAEVWAAELDSASRVGSTAARCGA